MTSSGASRTARVQRETSESSIDLSLDLDGSGVSDIETSVPFYDHLLTAFAKHSLTDLTVRARGDVEIDVHHTVEDVALVLGDAIAGALGDRAGITRFGDAAVPMDEALARCVAEVRAGADEAGRDPASVRVWSVLATLHEPDHERLLRGVTGRMAIGVSLPTASLLPW